MTVSTLWRRHEFSLLLATFCVVALAGVLDQQHAYFNKPWESAVDLVRQWSMLSLFALGAAVVIIAGGIDLSTGSVMALSGTVCAAILLAVAPEAINTPAAPLPVAALLLGLGGALLVGFLVGSLHAWLITRIGLPPFVATLATLVGLRSLARALCNEITLALSGSTSTQINIGNRQFRYLADSVWIPAVFVIIASLLLWLMLSRTVLGRHLYALGGNEQAARLSGIQTDAMKWVGYCLSAMLASLSGVLYVAMQSVAVPDALGRGYELNAIAASVVGGCSLQGGVGTAPGTLLGALFLRVVIDAVAKTIDTGADVFEGLIVGVVVVFAVTFTRATGTTTDRRGLFSGQLGWVTMLNLTMIAGVLTALLGVKFTKGRLNMDGVWLSAIATVATAALLLLSRGNWLATTRRRVGVAWATAVIVAVVGLDRAYPAVQTNASIAAVQRAGGKVVQNDAGIVVDLSDAALDDAGVRRLVPRFDHLHPFVELRLTNTKVTDRSIDALVKLKSLQLLDIAGTQITRGGALRLQRVLAGVTIRSPDVEPRVVP